MEKILRHIFIQLGVLFLCCSCFASGVKQYPPPLERREIDPFSVPPLPIIRATDPGAKRPKVPILSNPDFTVEELPLGVIKFKKEPLRMDNRVKARQKKMGSGISKIPEHMDNRAEKKTSGFPDNGNSLIWLSGYAIYALRLDSGELWANYSPYQSWSVESFCIAEAEYPKVLLVVSTAFLFEENRILKIDMTTGGIDGYFELPENLVGIKVLRSLGDNRYFAVSRKGDGMEALYGGDVSWTLSLLKLGDKPEIEKSVSYKKLGQAARIGFDESSVDGSVFYFRNSGYLVSVDVNKLEILKKQEMKEVPAGRFRFLEDQNKFCVYSNEVLTLFDPQTFEVLNSFEFPMQPALQDRIVGKSNRYQYWKGDPIYMPPSGVTYRNKTNELIVTFDYSPKMLLIDCETKEQRFVEFAEESITTGQPVYLDEEHMLIGGKYIYNFKTGAGKLIAGAEDSAFLHSLIYF